MRTVMALGACVASLLSAPVAAQEELRFNPTPILSCLAGANDLPAQESCVGLGATACMESDSMGYTTVGMGFCLDAELTFWDERLNVAYGQLMKKEKAMDEEMSSIGATVPSLAETLQAMQRAWIPYRDATCDYERAHWGGGTGGGPATLDCLMHLTGRQALKLEMRLTNDQ